MNLVGMKWSQLSEEERNDLLTKATVIDNVTGNDAYKTGDCIVNFYGTGLSVLGYVVIDDINIITIEDESIIYNSEEGLITD